MRLQVMSDLHLEHHLDRGRDFATRTSVMDVDALALLGDVLPLSRTEDAIERLAWFCNRWSKVLFVPGNHEYFGQYPDAAMGRLRKLEQALRNLTVLTQRGVEIGGRRILGGTMWYPEPIIFVKDFPDFVNIKKFVPWVYRENAKFVKFIRANLREGDVVLTHHAPTTKSISERWQRNAWNPFYVCDLTAEIVERKPALWCHGHMHEVFDYPLADTRIVCNPFGNPRQSTGFREDWVLEV